MTDQPDCRMTALVISPLLAHLRERLESDERLVSEGYPQYRAEASERVGDLKRWIAALEAISSMPATSSQAVTLSEVAEYLGVQARGGEERAVNEDADAPVNARQSRDQATEFRTWRAHLLTQIQVGILWAE